MIEEDIGTNRTAETLAALRRHFSRTAFLWIMGSDNALQFHRWHRWRAIIDSVAIGVIARPPAISLVRSMPLEQTGVSHRIVDRPYRCDLSPGNIYWARQARLNPLSSTSLRLEASRQVPLLLKTGEKPILKI